MGIKNLKKIIKAKAPGGISMINPYERFKNTKIAIDLNSYLYKFVYNSHNKTRNQYLKDLTDMIYQFLLYNITPIFVFDGKPSEAKNITLDLRKQATDQKKDKISNSINNIKKYFKMDIESMDLKDLSIEIEKLLSINEDLSAADINLINDNLSEITKNHKNIIKMTNEIYLNVEKLFKLWSVPYLKAKGEADFLCAKLYIDGIISAVCSEDMDLLPHGVGHLITGINSLDLKKTGETTLYTLDVILGEMEFTIEQFIDLCILAGCDYCDTIKNVGGMKGFQLLKQYKKIENIPGAKDDFIKARDEFIKSKLEIYDLDIINFKININSNILVEFLTTKTTFKKSTVTNKLTKLSGMGFTII